MHAAIAYWTDAAREQNRWRVELRAAARAERSVTKSGPLYDAARRCGERRDVFMAQARRVAAQLEASQPSDMPQPFIVREPRKGGEL